MYTGCAKTHRSDIAMRSQVHITAPVERNGAPGRGLPSVYDKHLRDKQLPCKWDFAFRQIPLTQALLSEGNLSGEEIQKKKIYSSPAFNLVPTCVVCRFCVLFQWFTDFPYSRKIHPGKECPMLLQLPLFQNFCFSYSPRVHFTHHLGFVGTIQEQRHKSITPHQ